LQVCKKLRKLDLAANKITELPSTFGELDSLEDAHFGTDREPERKDFTFGNHIQKLPDA
jgi:Leucine-rich repeat (LRR) protein